MVTALKASIVPLLLSCHRDGLPDQGQSAAKAAGHTQDRHRRQRDPPQAPRPVRPNVHYVSLGWDRVYARANPDFEGRIKWVYEARGLPLQVIAEKGNWRRVCDPGGDIAWVWRKSLASHRTLYNGAGRPIPLRLKGAGNEPVVAYLAPRAIADFEGCEAGWCRATVGRRTGWTPAGALWGTAVGFQCHVDYGNGRGPRVPRHASSNKP